MHGLLESLKAIDRMGLTVRDILLLRSISTNPNFTAAQHTRALGFRNSSSIGRNMCRLRRKGLIFGRKTFTVTCAGSSAMQVLGVEYGR